MEQDFGNGMQPAAYESRKLNPAETRYSAYERELLGFVWAIGKWRHYLEGRPFIVQTAHSSIKHLPNQPSISRCIWKWVSILQGFNVEIRYILGKVNPIDASTRIRADDEEYVERVRQEDQDWVNQVRVPSSATDFDIQQKLDQLYSKTEIQEQKKIAMKNVLPEHTQLSGAALAASKSTVSIDSEMRQ